MEIDPEFPRAYEGFAYVYRRHGRMDLAIPWREKAESIDPGDPRHSMALGQFYRQIGDEAQAAHWIELALQHEEFGLHGQVQELAAILSRQRGDEDAYERHARKAAESGFIRLLVISDLRRGDYTAARARIAERFPELFALKQSTTEHPFWDGFHAITPTELAFVLQHTGETELAGELLDRTQAQLGESPDLRLVAIHALRGDAAHALAKLRENGTIWTNHLGWQYHRDIDPRLDSIRDLPEFKAFFASVEAEMVAQRARLAARPDDAPLDIDGLGTLTVR
jgi:tetratricopeptide (TPR) repeat protein